MRRRSSPSALSTCSAGLPHAEGLYRACTCLGHLYRNLGLAGSKARQDVKHNSSSFKVIIA